MPPSISLTPPNSNPGLFVIKQTGISSSPPPPPGGPPPPGPPPPPPPGGSGIPLNWGMFFYPNPGTGTSDQGGGSQAPSGSANANLKFFTHGGSLGGTTVPGMGILTNCFNAWVNGGGDITSYSNGFQSEGGAFAASTGMIPLQGIVTGGVFAGGWDASTITNGSYDSTIRSWVTTWTNKGYTKIFYRLDWEWQISTTYRLNQASQVAARVAAWQYVYNILHNEASKHSGVQIWVGWNPCCVNSTNFPTSNAYPGDAYCDVIQTDMYFSGGMFDGSSWAGYSSLTPGSAAQLNGGSPGTVYSNQLDLYNAAISNGTMGDLLYHWADFPAATQFSPHGGSAVSASGDNFGHESEWGMMDVIHFAAQHKKPIGIAEGGFWSCNVGGGANKASSTSFGWNVGTGSYKNPGVADIWCAPYWKSRIAYAQSLGVQFLHFNWFMRAPNDPFYINGSSSGTSQVATGCVASINSTFGGTGVPLVGYTI